MKVSVVTVCFNSADTIEETVRSALSQDHGDVEYIVVDGGSTDGTLDILAKYRSRIAKFVSERDAGIYDAMNKGIGLAEGEVVGFLNGDDTYAGSGIIPQVVTEMATTNSDGVYGDLVYVQRDDTHRVIRYWRAGAYRPGAFHCGWVPPHPTFFCRRRLFKDFGLFDSRYRIAGDFELMLRFIEKHRIRLGYIPHPLVRMRAGGRANTIRGMIRGNREIIGAFRANGLRLSPRFFWSKPVFKMRQFTHRLSELIRT